MPDEKNKTQRRAALARSLSFPVCVSLGTAVGYLIGLAAGRGVDSIFPPQVTFALIGLVIGIVVSAVVATSIDIAGRRKRP